MLQLIFGGAAIVFVAALVLFPSFRKGLGTVTSGFLSVFIRDVSKTEKGANAIYTKAIEEAEEKYGKAKTAYHRVAGEHEECRIRIMTLKENIKAAERDAESLYKSGNIDKARVMAQQRSDLMVDLESSTKLMESLEPALAQAKNIYELCETDLRNLKKDKKKTLNELQAQNLMKDIMSDIDELDSSSTARKLINSTNEYLDDLRKENHGAMAVHASKLDSRVADAKKTAADLNTDAFLASLENKYHQGGQTGGTGGTAVSH